MVDIIEDASEIETLFRSGEIRLVQENIGMDMLIIGLTADAIKAGRIEMSTEDMERAVPVIDLTQPLPRGINRVPVSSKMRFVDKNGLDTALGKLDSSE